MQLKAQQSTPSQPVAGSSQQRWDQIKQAVQSPGGDDTPVATDGDPSSSGSAVVGCPDCGKPILESAIGQHALNCAKIRNRKSGSVPLKRTLSEASASGSNGVNSPKKSKHPSLVLTLKKNSKSSPAELLKQQDKERKRSKAGTGPLSPSRNCFVLNAQNQPCARSLTCKQHAMGAKRAVVRPQPFDILLHEWTKTHRPETLIDGKGPVRPRVGLGSEEYHSKDRKKRSGNSEKRREKEERTRVGERDESENEDEEIDSEEEVEAVMKALVVGKLGRGRPLGLHGGGGAGLSASSLFVQRNSKLSRLRDVLGGVFGKGLTLGPGTAA